MITFIRTTFLALLFTFSTSVFAAGLKPIFKDTQDFEQNILQPLLNWGLITKEDFKEYSYAFFQNSSHKPSLEKNLLSATSHTDKSYINLPTYYYVVWLYSARVPEKDVTAIRMYLLESLQSIGRQLSLKYTYFPPAWMLSIEKSAFVLVMVETVAWLAMNFTGHSIEMSGMTPALLGALNAAAVPLAALFLKDTYQQSINHARIEEWKKTLPTLGVLLKDAALAQTTNLNPISDATKVTLNEMLQKISKAIFIESSSYVKRIPKHLFCLWVIKNHEPTIQTSPIEKSPVQSSGPLLGGASPSEILKEGVDELLVRVATLL